MTTEPTPQDDLTGWSASLLLPDAAIDSGSGQDELPLEAARYGFAAGGYSLLLEQETPCEVLDADRVSPLPYTPRWLLGLINVRGNLVPVFDLVTLSDSHADLQRADISRKYFLIVDRDDRMAGFVIEQLPRVVHVSKAQPVHIPRLNALLQPHVSDALSVDGTTWLEFHHRNFLQALSDTLGLRNR